MKYELLYFTKTGDSNPLNGVAEVKQALFADTGHDISESEIFHGQTFTNGDEIILVNTYGDGDDDEEDDE
jgi:hypothetical protein